MLKQAIVKKTLERNAIFWTLRWNKATRWRLIKYADNILINMRFEWINILIESINILKLNWVYFAIYWLNRYIGYKILDCITHFAHNVHENLTSSLQTKAFKNFSSERDLNPRPSDYMSNALLSELSDLMYSSVLQNYPSLHQIRIKYPSSTTPM